MNSEKETIEAGHPLHTAIPFELWDDKDITRIDILVYGALRLFADFKTGDSCFPSVATLMKKSRLSERAVQGGLKHLQELGWLEMAKGEKGIGGRAHATRWKVLERKGRNQCGVSKKGCTDEPERAQKLALNPATTAPDLNPITNTITRRGDASQLPPARPGEAPPKGASPAFLEPESKERDPEIGVKLKELLTGLTRRREREKVSA